MKDKISINVSFEIGQIVYLKTDTEQFPRIVYAYLVYEPNHILYKVAQGTNISEHYEFELSEEKNMLLKML